jgi:hypothetical protein
MNINEKTLGQLIDELITTNLRCWFAQEDIMNSALSESQRLNAAIRAQEQNSKRTELIRALDKRPGGEGITNTTKTYHTYFKEKE